MRDADTEHIMEESEGISLEDAIEIAEDMINDAGEVEYGIWFK